MAAVLEQEIQTFENKRHELEEHHNGKWALVHDGEVIGLFETFDTAATEAVRQFGKGPYLIRQVGAPAPYVPASVAYFPRHASS